MMDDRSSYDLVVELLNQASLEQNGAAKVILLKQVQELVINKEPNLLDNFFDEIIGFQSDKSIEVRKFVVTFLEFACKVDGEILSKIIGNLNILLYDENVNIKKKIMLSMASLYRTAIKWIVGTNIITEIIEETWKYLHQMKDHIVALLDDDNDGIRTHSVKFCEAVVSALTPKAADGRDDDQSLDIVPEDHTLLKKEELLADGQKVFKLMLDFLGSQSITSVNLMACMTSMTSIARRRPQFMMQIIAGFESLHVNLPPTLSKSQVSSVRKSLKLQMLSLLKHPAAVDMISQIATLLTDLGATQSEVNKAMPKPSELAASRKRKAAEFEKEKQRAKKLAKDEMPALPVLPDVEEDEDDPKETPKPFNPVEITTEDIGPKLTNHNVADLVLLSMVMLPDEMPANFQSTYTPIAAAGTPGQIKHISRLLAVQLTNAGLGKGVEEQRRQKEEEDKKAKAKAQEDAVPETNSISVVGDQPNAPQPKAQFVVPLSGTSTKKQRAYDLKAVTSRLSVPLAANLSAMCFQRLFKAEAVANKANLNSAFSKILASLTTQFGGFYKTMLADYIMLDMKNRSDLALTWVYSEYVAYQGFMLAQGANRQSRASYDECLGLLLGSLMTKKDQPGSSVLFTRLLLECPQIPQQAVEVLRHYCTDVKHMYIGMQTLQEMILKRPSFLSVGLGTLLDLTYYTNPEVRSTAIPMVKDLYEKPEMAKLIDAFCKAMVNNLLAPFPTPAMFPSTPPSKFDGVSSWTEFFIKQALYLYLSMLPDNPSYLELLAEVYVKSVADIKRVVLRLMETPVKLLGMDSPHLLQFIRTSPHGSETLVTRIIHILTEKQAPSTQLVEIVKHLYKTRKLDIRFIIPVLGGLNKDEVLTVLPKLVSLAPAVVKEVFNRLLGVGGQTGQEAFITASDLMIALHNIPPLQCDIKSIIKATTMCFQEKGLFTQEVLAIVINQLIESVPLPTLFMRTVIQSFTIHPKLLGFVISILQRLIAKQIWKDKKAWEGFVRCCQRARPQSLQVLLQLPPKQLASAFEIAPELRLSLLRLISNYNTQQKSMLQKGVLAVIEQAEPQKETCPVTPVKDEAPEGTSQLLAGTVAKQPSVTENPVKQLHSHASTLTVKPLVGETASSSSSEATISSEPLPPGVEPAQISASLETVAQSISSTSNKSLESPPSSTNLTVALPSAALPVASAVQSAAPEPLDVQSPAAKPVPDLSAAQSALSESATEERDTLLTSEQSVAAVTPGDSLPPQAAVESLPSPSHNTAEPMEQTPTNESVTDPGLQLDDSITCEKAEDKEVESAKTGSSGVEDASDSKVESQSGMSSEPHAESTSGEVEAPTGSPVKSPSKRGKKRPAPAPVTTRKSARNKK